MSQKLVYLISFVLVLALGLTSVADAAPPGLIGWWKLDEMAGTFVFDSSGLENHGRLGGDPQWVAGYFGGALDLDGTDDHVEIDSVANDITDNNFSVSAWIKTTQVGDDDVIIASNASSGTGHDFILGVANGFLFVEANNANTYPPVINDNQWHHIAYVRDGTTAYAYTDGVLVGTETPSGSPSTDTRWSIGQEWDDNTPSDEYDGIVDEVQFYNRPLTAEEVEQVMIGVPPGTAFDPIPANEAIDVPRDVVLSWTPGEFASPVNGHKFYLSENFNDVNDGIGGITQSASSYAPGQRLDFGTTYYWRLDEVNNVNPESPWIGRVWSFTTELFAYPVENITATASSTGQDLENTINGSGLDANDLHSTQEADMWLSGGEPNVWIEYELDKVYKLYEMWVWNANGIMESVLGFGFKDVTIEHSTNGTDYTILGTTHEFVRAPGAVDYAHNTTVDFGSAAAKYVRLTANSNWGGFMPQYGLSEVRFLTIPVHARKPSPDSGAADVDIDVVLGFRAGREAVTHDAYLSADEQAVIDGNAPVTTVAEASYRPLSLDLDTTYYWKINEANEAETPTMWQGDIWSFTTTDHIIVDDFEDYNDYPPNEIWRTWIDGYGVQANGATVGYPNPDWNQEEHYVETTIVSGGKQAMPLFYDNSTAGYSEATVNITNLQVGQDWTKHGIKALTLRFFGDPSNAVQQMYVKINDSKVTYDGDTDNLRLMGWQMWYIDLASLSMNNVTELSIGFEHIGAVGGQGVVYFDDIRLYSHDRPLITPADPGTTGLVGHWKLDETSGLTAIDSSGSGNNGTLVNMTGNEWTAGILNGALVLDGISDYVDCGNNQSLQLTGEATISAWVKMEPDNEDVYMGIAGKIVVDPSYNGFALVRHPSNVFRMWIGNDGDLQNVSSDVTYNDTDWHHVVGVCQGGINHLYVDGVKQAGEAAVELADSGNYAQIGKQYSDRDYRYWDGTIDDVRIYDRALTPEEAAWLAGRTEPFDKPF